MTKEEILQLDNYCQLHNIRKVDRLKELGITYYNYNKSRKLYFNAYGSEIIQSNFIAITPHMAPIDIPNNTLSASMSRRSKRKEEQLAQGNVLTIEMRTGNGTELRIQGQINVALIKEIISSAGGK